MDRRGWRAVAMAAALAAMAGCTAGSGSGATVPTPNAFTASAAAIPECAEVGSAIQLPLGFPSDFPLPPGTVFDDVREAGGGVVLNGVVPLSFEEATRYLADHFPGSGLELGDSDSEAGEAEADFSGGGVRGRWKLHEIAGCDGASTLRVSIGS